MTDPVTGLGRRDAVEDVLRRHAAAPGARLGVLALELDAAGLPFEQRDAAMADAAARMRAVAGPGAIAGRTGACELVLVLGGELTEPIRATGERLRLALASEPFSAGALGVCVGVAAAPVHGTTGEELLQAALAARDTARELGGNQVRAAGEDPDLPLLESLADAVDDRRGLPGHSRRVSRWSAAVAAQLGLDADVRPEATLAGRLHDLALVSAPDALLWRPHPPGHRDDPRLDEHPLAALRLSAGARALMGETVASAERHRDPLAADPPLVARIVAVCNAWATLREGRPGRAPLSVEATRAHLLAGSGSSYAPDVVRAFLHLEARGEIGGLETEPTRSTVATVGEILAAAAATAAEPTPAPAKTRRRRRPALLLVAAILVFAAWTGGVVALQASAAHEKARVVELMKADRRWHELTSDRGRADLDVEIERTQVEADRRAALAWQLSTGSGVVVALVAGLLLFGFARTGRTAGRLRTAAALRESDRRLKALVQHASDSVLVIGADGEIGFATDAIEALLGHTPAELLGLRVAELVDPAHRTRLADLLRAARGMPDPTAGELTLRHRDGHAVYADLRVCDRLQDPDVTGVVLTVRDVTEKRRLESELRRSGFQDRLTGLANRSRFEEWLQDGLARGAALAMLLVDLDDLKSVNDSLGHPAGDRCLVVWAQRLRDALAGGGRLARVGGDQFGVLLEGVADLRTAEQVARRLLDAGSGAVELDGVDLPLTASAGVALAAPGDLAEDVLRSADTAAHAAKSHGGGHVAVFSPSMLARAVRRLELRTTLARAVESEEFELAYQPIVTIASGETKGVEALLRWRTPDGEPVSPADFIPTAEATGLIVPLGAWVLERACADVAPLGDLTVAVNVSAVQLRRADFVEQVAAALAHSGLAPQRLTVELTESALMDDVDAAHAAFSALQALGVRVAIDDFGTGFSSLAKLADLPVDVLKLDRSFVAAMSDSAPHAALVGGVVSLADRVGLPLVAEGVETAEQLAALRDLGCAFAQGYHLGRPGPLAAVDGRMRSLR